MLFFEMFHCATPGLKVYKTDQFISKHCFSSFLEEKKHISFLIFMGNELYKCTARLSSKKGIYKGQGEGKLGIPGTEEDSMWLSP